MTTADRALALAAAGRACSVEALRELVRIPSLTGEEGEAQARVAAWLAELGAETHVAEPDVAACFERFPEVAQYPTHWQHDLILPYADLPTAAALRASGLEGVLNYRGRPNVVGVVRGTGGGRSLLLNGHVDTVTVEPRGAWTRDPFGAEVADGLLYGRGASDMKGGLVAALMALGYLRAAGVRLAGDVIVQSVVNEEHAGNGTLDLVRRGWRADAAIVLEPTENRVAVSHPGGLYWQVTVPGVPRSPGARWEERPPGRRERDREAAGDHRGVARPRARGARPRFLRPGHREGGRRTLRDGDGGRGRAPGRRLLRARRGGRARRHAALPRGGGARQRGRSVPSRAPGPPRVPPPRRRHPPARRRADRRARERAAGPARGDGRIGPGPFACDMRHLVNQGGIPSIIFGPGTIAQAHKPDEHIPVQEYLDCVEHLVEIIATWCGAPVAAASDRRKEPVP